MAGMVENLEAAVAHKTRKPLTAAQRKAIPRSKFAVPAKAPGSGSYPIEDLSHARNALARASGKPVESKVRAAVVAAYPRLKK